ncbi:MAG: hypothetical protein KBC81_03120 [Candidatus Pacebacteria bacterium]|nr:hypothetical protein [Candidatus Paceibacterota bacterium]
MEHVRLAIAAAVVIIHGTAFFFYTKQMKQGLTRPNITTWSITMFLMVLNTLTFREMSKDLIATAQLFIGTTGCSIVFFYALAKGKFSAPGRTGGWSLLFGVIAAIVWYMFREASWANMIVLVALFVALIPTWDGVYHDPFKEMPRSWAMWAFAYLLTTVNMVLNPSVQLVALVNPISAVIAHGVVAVLCSEFRKRNFRMR